MIATVVLAFAASQTVSLPASVQEVGWLSGCWIAADGERGTEEHWLAPAGGSLLGVARTVRGGRTVGWEFMRIVEDDGRLVFIAAPSGQQGAAFPLVSAKGERLVFENTTHDFPQRVVYERTGTDGLLGRIEGTRDGTAVAVDFPYRRGACH
jgi:hypothetical protein